MNGKELLEKMELIDSAYIEAASVAPRKKRYSTLKAWVAISACLVLLISATLGAYAFAKETKRYNDAVAFFDDYDLKTDGLSRAEIKRVYRDIITKSFSYSKTSEVIINSMSSEQLSGYEILQENITSEYIGSMAMTLGEYTDIFFPLLTAIYENPTGYGRIVRDEGGNIKAIVEEKDADIEQKAVKEVNAGIYCLNWTKIKDAFGELKTNNAQGEYYLTDIVKWANNKNLKVNAHILKNNEEIFGINSKAHLAEATKILNTRVINKHLENGVTIVDPSTVWISPETEIEADTIIYPSCYINGKNKIGKNCKIGPFAHIRGGVTLEDNVKIGNFVEVKKTTIKSNTNACHLSYLGDSEIGSGVNIGAGTITANYNSLNYYKG